MKLSNYLLVIFCFLLAGCSKNEDDPGPSNPYGNTSITINSSWQFSFKFDGIIYSRTEGVSNSEGYFSWVGSILPPPDSSKTNFGSSLANLNDPINSFSISIGMLKYISEVDTNLFKSFIHTGVFSFSQNTLENGATIFWVDSFNKHWSTSYGSGDQNGSSFIITDVQNLGMNMGLFYQIKFKATFNCKLYDQNGNSKTLTDGVYVGVFENHH